MRLGEGEFDTDAANSSAIDAERSNWKLERRVVPKSKTWGFVESVLEEIVKVTCFDAWSLLTC